MAIVDATGTAVVSYAYDAWGNILSVTGTMADTLGKSNPLRYRGYVYDNETELYYLQSRYYDPELGRFINADALVSTGQGILGNNMFAYCRNNPVNSFDPGGTASVSVFDENMLIRLIGYIGHGGGGTCGSGSNRKKVTSKNMKTGLINNQQTFLHSSEAVGLSTYAASGCAIIATYNVMQLLGKPTSLGSIRDEYLYQHGTILFGLGGCGPWSFDNYFENHGINCTGYSSFAALNANVSEGDVIIFTVMNNWHNAFNGFHTMAAQYTGGVYLVYNVYSNSTTYSTFLDLTAINENTLWIYGYIVGG